MPLSIQEQREIDDRLREIVDRITVLESLVQVLIDRVSVLNDHPAERENFIAALIDQVVK